MPGRKNKYPTYVEPYLAKVTKWARDGMFDKDIARALGVSVAVFSGYKNEYPELDKALKSGRRTAVTAIENALFAKALPHQKKVTTKEVYKSASGKGAGKQMIREEITEVDGDTTAAIFLLKAWEPDRYREKTEVNMNIAPVEIVDDIQTAIESRNHERSQDTD
ncbi:transposase [Leuconostoc citreum]|uniref:hypothetical protein n=1 Tax=Leuconostoc citreum TaxID=33964 RepID=UPI0021A5F859|nr:hypothetical protein [Leuconostoc citreum]MCT3075333.1 transposase [Leuconostoc citreum]